MAVNPNRYTKKQLARAYDMLRDAYNHRLQELDAAQAAQAERDKMSKAFDYAQNQLDTLRRENAELNDVIGHLNEANDELRNSKSELERKLHCEELNVKGWEARCERVEEERQTLLLTIRRLL